MNNLFTISQATIEDLNGIVHIFDKYRIFYGQESDIEGARQFLFDRFEHLESVIFIARDINEEVIAFAQLYPLFSSVSMKRIWLLNDLYVEEAHRGKDVGKAMLDHAKKFAVLTKAKGLEIATQVTNEKAQRVYQNNGYVLDEEFYHYYQLV